LFLGENQIDNHTFDKALIDALRKYPNAQRELFGSRAKGLPEPREVKKLITLLLTVQILTYRISFDKDDKDKKNPIVLARLNYSDGNLFLYDNACWSRIPSKPAIVVE